MSESTSFDLNAFIKESKETLLNPKAYFSTMKTSGGMAEPVIKALIYGVVAGIIVFLWGILGLGGLDWSIRGRNRGNGLWYMDCYFSNNRFIYWCCDCPDNLGNLQGQYRF